MGKKRDREDLETKILDVDASMQGTITFRDPVNLRINGSFEGKLDTKGNLSIGENAIIKADVSGDRIIIAGIVTGNVTAHESLTVVAPARVHGDIFSPVLSVTDGALINGKITMSTNGTIAAGKELLTLKELAQYLEVETAVLEEWAQKKKIPSYMENNALSFKKTEIDHWIQEEKIKI
jgi:excisionase family DNA binding protein